MTKNLKIAKEAHAFKGYASSYNVEILNSFNLELHLKYTESAIKIKFKKLQAELRRFKFVTTLAIVFIRIESDDKTKHNTFYLN